MHTQPLILVTNDDGFTSEGLIQLRKVAARFGRVVVVTPEHERSGVSHAITLSDPIRVREVDEDFFALTGTPVDCVFVGINHILGEIPDLVLSGINRGPNLGHDVIYSGTVGGALEGVIQGTRAIAFSLVGPSSWPFGEMAPYAERIVGEVLHNGLPRGVMLNVNFPAVRPVRGIKVVRLGRKLYSKDIIERCDPRGRKYLWIGGTRVTMEEDPHTDCGAIVQGFVTVSPLDADILARASLRELAQRLDYEVDSAGTGVAAESTDRF